MWRQDKPDSGPATTLRSIHPTHAPNWPEADRRRHWTGRSGQPDGCRFARRRGVRLVTRCGALVEPRLLSSAGVAVDSPTAEGLTVGTSKAKPGANSNRKLQHAGFGNYLALFKRRRARIRRPVPDNLSCHWAAINGSTGSTTAERRTADGEDRPASTCAGDTSQRNLVAVMPLARRRVRTGLRYTVYRDLPLTT
jgi:hypothetical protein